MNDIFLEIPGADTKIIPGCKIRLHRFETVIWTVGYGWYSWGGNRETCGWYLIKDTGPDYIKPLYKTDLDDCYLVEYN